MNILSYSDFNDKFWKYYLVLEKNVLETEQYITFDRDNYKCFSNEYIKIFQAICSEIDVVAKDYCEYVLGRPLILRNECNIEFYKKIIMQNQKYLPRYTVHSKIIKEFNYKPWISFGENKNPIWWKHYNSLKHRRTGTTNFKDIQNKNKFIENYKLANLENVLYALSALFLLENFYHVELRVGEKNLEYITHTFDLLQGSELFNI
jgi:hypothetical protein